VKKISSHEVWKEGTKTPPPLRFGEGRRRHARRVSVTSKKQGFKSLQTEEDNIDPLPEGVVYDELDQKGLKPGDSPVDLG